jgi:DNA-binding NarL/FixJ family response regulator
LTPALIVLDLSLAGRNFPLVLQEICDLSPSSRVILLTVHDEATVARMALAAGAHSVVLKRSIGSDFLNAVSAVLRGHRFVSSGFGFAEILIEKA